MPLLDQKEREALQRVLYTGVKRDVNLKLYTKIDTGLFIPGRDCPYCGHTQEIVEEVSALSPRIHLEVVDFYKDQEDASSRGIDRIPALTIGVGRSDNIRYYGMPSGHEFPVLVDSIIGASQARTSLQLETRRQLKRLKEDVHIRVFVTPKCQHSPDMALLAYTMAMESRKVTADVVEIQEFPALASLRNVMSVPKTIINNRVQFTGAVSEEVLLRHVLKAVGAEDSEGDNIGEVFGRTTLLT